MTNEEHILDDNYIMGSHYLLGICGATSFPLIIMPLLPCSGDNSEPELHGGRNNTSWTVERPSQVILCADTTE